MKRQKPHSKLTIQGVAQELGVNRETLRKRLLAIDVKPDSPTLRWREVFTAWIGDKSAALTRRQMAEAELMELKAARMRGDMLLRDEAEAMVRSWLGPLRDVLVACPEELAARLNPSDPEHARSHLMDWRDRALRVMGGADLKAPEVEMIDEDETEKEEE
jgi:hypothetical protein